MEIGDFEKIIEDKETEQIASSILKEDIKQISRICEQWGENEDEVKGRFIKYWQRVLRRAQFLADKPVLRKAYQIFLDRQLTAPCTLSNGDFLEFNAMFDGEKVVMIDWGFGGMMPYSLDIARFIAHATETRCTFPFYMNDSQKELFLNEVYAGLKDKISYEQFRFDIKLALLNEYVEFVEAEEDEDDWYLEHAEAIAQEICDTMYCKTHCSVVL